MHNILVDCVSSLSRKKVKLMNLEVRLQRVKISNKKQSIHSGDHLVKNPQTSHKGKTTFSCNYCPKAFARSGDLNRHLRIHNGEKPFSCSYCPKAFAQLGNLKIHLRTHTGEKPFNCSYCPKAFTTSGHLNPLPTNDAYMRKWVFSLLP